MTRPKRAAAPFLIGVGLITAVFYAGAPLFYSYFEAVTVSYGRAFPLSLLNHRPLAWWGALVELYLPAGFVAPAADENIACRLSSTAPAPHRATGTGCEFRLDRHDTVYGPYMALPPGAYTVRYSVAPAPECATTTVSVDVLTGGRERLAVAEAAVTRAMVIELPFRMTNAALILQGIETRIAVTDGCGTLTRVTLERTG